jgi:hypothetical protein
MSDLETSIKDAWVSYIEAHEGQNANPAEIKRSVFRERHAVTHSSSTPRQPDLGDFVRLERYIESVDPEKFKRDVSYQLYYVTECLIWLWKRLPREILVRDEGRNSQDERIDALLRDLNIGTIIENLTSAEKAELPDKRQGSPATPANGMEVIVKRGEFVGPASVREMAVIAQSHEPPPPPPGWPGE